MYTWKLQKLENGKLTTVDKYLLYMSLPDVLDRRDNYASENNLTVKQSRANFYMYLLYNRNNELVGNVQIIPYPEIIAWSL